MDKRHLTAGLVALAITFSGAALAESIYKWTDADGNVHYGDRPTGEAAEERMHMTYARTDGSSVQRSVDSYRGYAETREKAREDAAEAKKAEDEERAQAEERTAQCEKARAQLKHMLEARRVYREDENGERDYLDEAERVEARSRAETFIEENCS